MYKFKIMKKLALVFGIFFLLMSQDTKAQISYLEDAAVQSIYNRYIAQNRATTLTLGWRIQILSTNDRRKMERVKSEFENNFPSMVPVWTYEAPNYKIRVGAFKTKMDTEHLRNTLRSKYPSAFPVKDNKIKPIEYL